MKEEDTKVWESRRPIDPSHQLSDNTEKETSTCIQNTQCVQLVFNVYDARQVYGEQMSDCTAYM